VGEYLVFQEAIGAAWLIRRLGIAQDNAFSSSVYNLLKESGDVLCVFDNVLVRHFNKFGCAVGFQLLLCLKYHFHI